MSEIPNTASLNRDDRPENLVFSSSELIHANARLKKILQILVERKAVDDHASFNGFVEIIASESQTIEKFSSFAVGEIQRLQSANLQLTLQNIDFQCKIADLDFDKDFLFKFLKGLKGLYMEQYPEFFIQRNDMLPVNKVDREIRKIDDIIKRTALATHSNDSICLSNEDYLHEVIYLLYH